MRKVGMGAEKNLTEVEKLQAENKALKAEVEKLQKELASAKKAKKE